MSDSSTLHTRHHHLYGVFCRSMGPVAKNLSTGCFLIIWVLNEYLGRRRFPPGAGTSSQLEYVSGSPKFWLSAPSVSLLTIILVGDSGGSSIKLKVKLLVVAGSGSFSKD